MARQSNRLSDDPYLLLFPVGAILGGAGVGQWVLYATGLSAEYRSIFHSMVQIQGFLSAFAAGFLLTMVPRRTQSPRPPPWIPILASMTLIGMATFAWFERWPASQLCWWVFALVLLIFLVRGLYGKKVKRRPPPVFVWLPLSIGVGILGSVFTAAGGIFADSIFWLHRVGMRMVTQGMFLGLVIGVGALAVPVMTGHRPPRDHDGSGADRRRVLLHSALGLALVSSFFVEQLASTSIGLGVRLVLAIVGLLGAGAHRRPAAPGWNRWLIWLSAWLVPVGYLVSLLVPGLPQIGLHIVFVGGFSLLALAVGVQVVVGHGGREDLKNGRPIAVAVYGGLVLMALASRILMELFATQRQSLTVFAAGAFTISLAVWASFLVASRLTRRARQ